MYIIEGNIGAGKSTFLALLAQEIKTIKAVFEPRHYWQGCDDAQSLLAHFYTDTHRWAYTMETYALMCRVKEHIKEQGTYHPAVVCERSIYSGYYCFAKNGYQRGFLSEHEWYVYNTWFSFLSARCDVPRGFIYLRTDPQLSHMRIKKRSRMTESGVSLDYVQQIHDCYEQFLIHKKDVMPHLKSIPVLVLDANQEFEENPTVLNEYVIQVKKFIQDHSNIF